MTFLEAITAASLVVLAATPVLAQQDEDTNTLDDTPHVTIVGAAHAEVVPDLAEISLGVDTEKPRAIDAMAETSRITAAVIEAAKAQGVSPRDIGTQNVTLTQTFDTITDARGASIGRKPRGFEAKNSILIRVRAIDKAGALAQTLIEKGTTQFNGIGFSTENPEPVMDRLHGEAVRDAKRKATIAAEALGAKLGRVLLIERPQTVQRFGIPAMAVSRKVMATAMPIEAGTQSLGLEMEVTWALE